MCHQNIPHRHKGLDQHTCIRTANTRRFENLHLPERMHGEHEQVLPQEGRRHGAAAAEDAWAAFLVKNHPPTTSPRPCALASRSWALALADAHASVLTVNCLHLSAHTCPNLDASLRSLCRRVDTPMWPVQATRQSSTLRRNEPPGHGKTGENLKCTSLGRSSQSEKATSSVSPTL